MKSIDSCSCSTLRNTWISVYALRQSLGDNIPNTNYHCAAVVDCMVVVVVADNVVCCCCGCGDCCNESLMDAIPNSTERLEQEKLEMHV